MISENNSPVSTNWCLKGCYVKMKDCFAFRYVLLPLLFWLLKSASAPVRETGSQRWRMRSCISLCSSFEIERAHLSRNVLWHAYFTAFSSPAMIISGARIDWKHMVLDDSQRPEDSMRCTFFSESANAPIRLHHSRHPAYFTQNIDALE